MFSSNSLFGNALCKTFRLVFDDAFVSHHKFFSKATKEISGVIVTMFSSHSFFGNALYKNFRLVFTNAFSSHNKHFFSKATKKDAPVLVNLCFLLMHSSVTCSVKLLGSYLLMLLVPTTNISLRPQRRLIWSTRVFYINSRCRSLVTASLHL